MNSQTQPLTLNKLGERKEIVLDLKKEFKIESTICKVALCLDFSASMNPLYKEGQVQELVERLLPIGLAFDDNGEVDSYIFSSRPRKLPTPVTLSNVHDYVRMKILSNGWDMGSTVYSSMIQMITEDFSNPTTGGGFLGLGKKITAAELPTYVIFITDGNCDSGDEARTNEAMIAASHHGIFFQFVGIGRADFHYLKELDTMSGRLIDNANFFKQPDLAATTDEVLYRLLLGEFPGWLPQARGKGLIK